MACVNTFLFLIIHIQAYKKLWHHVNENVNSGSLNGQIAKKILILLSIKNMQFLYIKNEKFHTKSKFKILCGMFVSPKVEQVKLKSGKFKKRENSAVA